MKRPFDWDLIQSFLSVARAGKLTVAARQLKIDHSTLSRRIMLLEDLLGTKLFDRHVSGYRLTQQGERVVVRAEEIESSVLNIHAEVAGTSSQIAGTVRIGAPDGFGVSFLAPIIGDLAQLHPNLHIELVATPRSFSLSEREADIAISFSRPTHGRLYARKLTDYELGTYGSRANDVLWHNIKTISDFARIPFISYIDDLIFTPELDYIPLISKSIVPRVRSSSIVAQVQAAASGNGIAVLPCFIADADPRLMRILADEVRLTRTFWMIVRSDMRDLARIRVTAQFIADRVRHSHGRFLPRKKA